MCCSVLQCVAVCCSVLQCVAMCCSVLPRVAVIGMISGQYSQLPSVRIYSDLNTHGMGPDRSCSKVLPNIMTLQYTATHCNILQYIATYCNYCNTMQHTATHYNTLQHTTTHCNTLQHTATRCNTLQHAASSWARFAPRTSLILSIRASLHLPLPNRLGHMLDAPWIIKGLGLSVCNIMSASNSYY